MNTTQPPLRYFVGCILIAAESVLIEKSAHIASGGVSGLSIGIADYLHASVGLVNLCIKAIIFGVVYHFGGKITAFWTMAGAGITGVSMWLIESMHINFHCPQWFAFGFIILFSKLPIGLLVSKGCSIGGFTAIGQLLEQHMGIPLSWSLVFMNLLSALAMLASHGFLSGFLTAIIALSTGITTTFWSETAKGILDKDKMG